MSKQQGFEVKGEYLTKRREELNLSLGNFQIARCAKESRDIKPSGGTAFPPHRPHRAYHRIGKH